MMHLIIACFLQKNAPHTLGYLIIAAVIYYKMQEHVLYFALKA